METEERMFTARGGRMPLCTSATDIPLPPCRPDPERDSGERALGEEGEYHH